ncbi:hypothetical protein FGU71_02400 [Erythrobacter insulae]|uniref:Uncharacterized protein n=1 Tax=Erythrobacter insulae TaxID=2584124 RepID=A0A547P9K0_9SPHN|nr:hypothetical protein [Erythrobacter insulae]TRD10828.1 hypothetical protein FGU71_02400 [Erythrobacter insulae]
MSEASFASLNPALLARKGGAKPAMRPQLAPLPNDPAEMAAMADEQLEDLGWNDMGGENAETPRNTATNHGPDRGAEVVSITASAANEDIIEAPSPIVCRQQKDLSERVLAQAAMPTSEKIAEQTANRAARTIKKAKTSGRRAAFTLRLDPERHLKLRLASTIKGISAQALVTEALDAMLTEFQELDALAERMKRN